MKFFALILSFLVLEMVMGYPLSDSSKSPCSIKNRDDYEDDYENGCGFIIDHTQGDARFGCNDSGDCADDQYCAWDGYCTPYYDGDDGDDGDDDDGYECYDHSECGDDGYCYGGSCYDWYGKNNNLDGDHPEFDSISEPKQEDARFESSFDHDDGDHDHDDDDDDDDDDECYDHSDCGDDGYCYDGYCYDNDWYRKNNNLDEGDHSGLDSKSELKQEDARCGDDEYYDCGCGGDDGDNDDDDWYREDNN